MVRWRNFGNGGVSARVGPSDAVGMKLTSNSETQLCGFWLVFFVLPSRGFRFVVVSLSLFISMLVEGTRLREQEQSCWCAQEECLPPQEL